MENFKKNTQKQEINGGNNSKIAEVEKGWLNAKKAIDDAIYGLGKAYFEANGENTDSEFAAQIEIINRKIREEYLWHQYRLGLDGQRMCDSCHSFITADSAFCNRCGATVAPIDFSPIAGTANTVQTFNPSGQRMCCTKCGKPLAVGAVFCEACGTRIG